MRRAAATAGPVEPKRPGGQNAHPAVSPNPMRGGRSAQSRLR
ncbi:hypothetical protein HMPREF0043_00120 [Actinobaculum sp. oral taxon 183 str. F0552]|nr:hypothetical protein HMPREF0043_00120 [Actinobaculum sp. oral taxon 183 str. F0552]